MTVDTGRVTDRRTLRFNSPADLRAEIERIAAAERSGTLRRTGNWTAGQTFGHLATWVRYAYDGMPIRPPWFVKMILRMKRRTFFDGPMPAGVKIPKVESGTLGTHACDLDEGLTQVTRAWDRLEETCPTAPHAIFGTLSHQDWIRMHLRHAELHLSFLHP